MTQRDHFGARQERKTQRGRHDNRHAQGCQERHDVGVGQGGEQQALHTRQSEDRQEDEHDDHGGKHDRRTDLERGIAYHRRGRTALSRRQQGVLTQSAHHVLHIDNRVVHERADGDGQSAKRHRVDGHVETAKHENRRGQRERDGGQRDGGSAHVGQKREHHDDDQQTAITQRRDHVVDRHLDEVGLSEDPPIDGDPLRQIQLQRVELTIEPFGHLDRVGAGLLLHADDNRRGAVARPFAALERRAFLDVRDVADQHRACSPHRHDAVADFVRGTHSSDRLQDVFLRPLRIDPGRRVLAGASGRVE